MIRKGDMKTISIIATGGTIASSQSEKGLKPVYTIEDMVNNLPELSRIANLRTFQLMNIDSSDMQPGDWVKIAVSVYKELQYSDGVVITHGTDTMAYTSSMLSFMLLNVNKPVILTGSQRPWNEKGTDAKTNLIDAVKVALKGEEINLAGVYIVFSGKIIKGCRAKKTKFLERTDLDAFETVNFPLIGTIKGDQIMMNPIIPKIIPKINGKMDLDTRISKGIFMLMLTPGIDPSMLASLEEKCKAIIIQAYGLGGMPIHGKDAFTPIIKKWIDSGIIVAITSQACFETDLNQYEVGRRFLELGVVPTLDMTQESAYTKTMWILGHTQDKEKVREMMWTNYSGEVWYMNGNNGHKKPFDILSEMARSHDLTRRLYESNTELLQVLSEIFDKVGKSIKKYN